MGTDRRIWYEQIIHETGRRPNVSRQWQPLSCLRTGRFKVVHQVPDPVGHGGRIIIDMIILHLPSRLVLQGQNVDSIVDHTLSQ